MPVMIAFDRQGPRSRWTTEECGPYRMVEVTSDTVFAHEGIEPFALAHRQEHGWILCGYEDQGPFQRLRVMPEVAQREADLAAELDSLIDEPAAPRSARSKG